MSGGPIRNKTDIYSEQQVRSALNKSGIRIASEISSHFIVFCIYHSNHSTPSAEVDKESGLFYCFSCQSTTDLTHLVMKANKISYFQAKRLIGEYDYNITELISGCLDEEEFTPFDQAIIDRLHSQVWGEGSDYLHSRNISDRSIQDYTLGFSSTQGMVAIPIHTQNGSLAGIVGRSVSGKRFNNSRGLQKSRLLFNLHRVWTSPHVYVVESSFDTIRLGQVGIAAVATLGASISVEQIDLLKRSFDEITIIPDRDAAGDAMTLKIQKIIPYANIWTLPDGIHDVGDLSDEELCGIIK
jgi:DNA primase